MLWLQMVGYFPGVFALLSLSLKLIEKGYQQWLSYRLPTYLIEQCSGLGQLCMKTFHWSYFAKLYSNGLFLHYQLVTRSQILSQRCRLSIRDYKRLLDLQAISAIPTIGCGNAILFVSLKLEIRISVVTAKVVWFARLHPYLEVNTEERPETRQLFEVA